jgi:hypothetical protein
LSFEIKKKKKKYSDREAKEPISLVWCSALYGDNLPLSIFFGQKRMRCVLTKPVEPVPSYMTLKT